MRDFVLNGVGHGEAGQAVNVTNRLFGGRFDPGLLRPYIETDPRPQADHFRGRPCADVAVGMVYNHDAQNADGSKGAYEVKAEKYLVSELQALGVNSPVFNATTLTRDDWIQIDRAVLKATRQRLTAYEDLRAANVYGGFDAWSKLTIEYSAITDGGEVVKDMDATSPGRADTPLALIRSTPLPVLHGDFFYPQRLLDQTRGTAMPLDTTMVEQVTRRLWESVEKCLIGTETGLTYGTRTAGPFPHTGTSTEYGYTNFPYRVTKTNLTTPLGTNPQAVMQDVMAMIETMNGNGYFGPFVLYHSTPYSVYLNDDYFRSGGTSAVRTVRERLMEIEGISKIARLDFLTTGYQLLLLDLGTGQFQAVDGMMPRTVQWSERGGMIQKFMVMAIQTQILRSPYNGVAAIVHGTTS